MKFIFIFILIFLYSLSIKAATIQVAVASNFVAAMKEIAQHFEQETGHRVNIIMGSTGKHYAQIYHGAPFDLFFAADSKRPLLLEKKDLIQAGTRFTYAIGKLVLWTANSVDVKKLLQQGTFKHLAIASPKLAPYGKAAEAVLKHMRLWQTLRHKMVRGENINQAFQFVKSGNAELGFVAYSQIAKNLRVNELNFWKVPQKWYKPIKQQAVLLKNNQPARDFLDFFKTAEVLTIINNHGYGVP